MWLDTQTQILLDVLRVEIHFQLFIPIRKKEQYHRKVQKIFHCFRVWACFEDIIYAIMMCNFISRLRIKNIYRNFKIELLGHFLKLFINLLVKSLIKGEKILLNYKVILIFLCQRPYPLPFSLLVLLLCHFHLSTKDYVLPI